MRCLHINIRKSSLILLTILINRIQMANNPPEQLAKEEITNTTNDDSDKITVADSVLHCPSNYDVECKDLTEACIKCELNPDCRYGKTISVNCRKKPEVNCRGPTKFQRNFTCRYCFQTDHWEYTCDLKANCNSVSSPQSTYVTNCTVNGDVLCLGYVNDSVLDEMPITAKHKCINGCSRKIQLPNRNYMSLTSMDKSKHIPCQYFNDSNFVNRVT